MCCLVVCLVSIFVLFRSLYCSFDLIFSFNAPGIRLSILPSIALLPWHNSTFLIHFLEEKDISITLVVSRFSLAGPSLYSYHSTFRAAFCFVFQLSVSVYLMMHSGERKSFTTPRFVLYFMKESRYPDNACRRYPHISAFSNTITGGYYLPRLASYGSLRHVQRCPPVSSPPSPLSDAVPFQLSLPSFWLAPVVSPL